MSFFHKKTTFFTNIFLINFIFNFCFAFLFFSLLSLFNLPPYMMWVGLFNIYILFLLKDLNIFFQNYNIEDLYLSRFRFNFLLIIQICKYCSETIIPISICFIFLSDNFLNSIFTFLICFYYSIINFFFLFFYKLSKKFYFLFLVFPFYIPNLIIVMKLSELELNSHEFLLKFTALIFFLILILYLFIKQLYLETTKTL